MNSIRRIPAGTGLATQHETPHATHNSLIAGDTN